MSCSDSVLSCGSAVFRNPGFHSQDLSAHPDESLQPEHLSRGDTGQSHTGQHDDIITGDQPVCDGSTGSMESMVWQQHLHVDDEEDLVVSINLRCSEARTEQRCSDARTERLYSDARTEQRCSDARQEQRLSEARTERLCSEARMEQHCVCHDRLTDRQDVVTDVNVCHVTCCHCCRDVCRTDDPWNEEHSRKDLVDRMTRFEKRSSTDVSGEVSFNQEVAQRRRASEESDEEEQLAREHRSRRVSGGCSDGAQSCSGLQGGSGREVNDSRSSGSLVSLSNSQEGTRRRRASED